MKRIAVAVLVLALAGCGVSGADKTATTDLPATTTTEVTTTTSPTTTTDAPTTTVAPAGPALPFTVSAWASQWTLVQSSLLELSGEQIEDFRADDAGDGLWGSHVTDDSAVYVEAPDRSEPILSAMVATAPGSPTPARLVAAVGSSLVDASEANVVLSGFNERVLPNLAELTDWETRFEVADGLDLIVVVTDDDPLALLFIWLPSGADPSSAARSARF